MLELKDILRELKKHYGTPELPPANGPFELVMWENACYLLPDARRTEVFEGLRAQVGLTAEAIHNADHQVLLELAKRGGMRPETRVFRWREIARITIEQFGGSLDQLLKEPFEVAKKALKQFPTIGDPGVEKILLYCGASAGLPLESNGLRVLTRVGFGIQQKQYGAMYQYVQQGIRGMVPRGASSLASAHLLLRQHGKTLCRNNRLLCAECPIEHLCRYPMKTLDHS